MTKFRSASADSAASGIAFGIKDSNKFMLPAVS